MPKDKPIRAVTTTVDPQMGRDLQTIERKLDLKPAVVARKGLRRVVPELLKEAATAP